MLISDLVSQSVRWYVCELEKTIISVCSRFGIEASTSPHTGVWVRDNKICAIGTTSLSSGLTQEHFCIFDLNFWFRFVRETLRHLLFFISFIQ